MYYFFVVFFVISVRYFKHPHLSHKVNISCRKSLKITSPKINTTREQNFFVFNGYLEQTNWWIFFVFKLKWMNGTIKPMPLFIIYLILGWQCCYWMISHAVWCSALKDKWYLVFKKIQIFLFTGNNPVNKKVLWNV